MKLLSTHSGRAPRGPVFAAPARYALAAAAALATLLASPATLAQDEPWDHEFEAEISAELRWFYDDPQFSGQFDGTNLSVSVLPEYYAESDDRNHSVTFSPFARLDEHDDERSHWDIREAYYRYAARNWELRAGLRRVFWGVTESQHLVDIINQTDFVENADGEDKLGQPMINLALISRFGTLDLFFMPYFREATAAGVEGRLRPPLPIDTDDPRYESTDEENHHDFAVRWFKPLGPWDIGLSQFVGTSRTPKIVPTDFVLTPQGPQPTRLLPYYDQLKQTGLDLQATFGGWLLKLEAVYRDDSVENYSAAVGGFEYTLVGVVQSAVDVGLLAEYHYDERGKQGTSPFDDDLFLGTRIAFNDVAGTDLLAGAIIDLDNDAIFGSVEAGRRFGANWKGTVEARVFASIPDSDPLASAREDSHLQVELTRYF